MFNYIVTHEHRHRDDVYPITTNLPINEAKYGNGDTISDPAHLKILKQLELAIPPHIDEFLSIFMADEPTYIDLG